MGLQQDERPANGESITPGRYVGGDLVIKDGIQSARPPVLASDPIVCPCQGLYSTVQRFDVFCGVTAFAVCLTDQTADERQHVANTVIELGDEEFLSPTHARLLDGTVVRAAQNDVN